MQGTNDDDLEDAELGDYPGLLAVSQFARMIRNVPWFSMLGEALDGRELLLAQDYCAGLGFPEAAVTLVESWEEAEDVARNPDWNTGWWEAEEQARVALVAEACGRADEEMVMLALTHVTNAASRVVLEAAADAAEHAGIADEGLIRAAAGAATQGCYQAALVLAAEAEDQEQHPFALKYRLFESGRWPLGVVGASYYLF